MSAIAFPAPDAGILARRESIVAGLARLVPPQALITSDDERRPYETDALTAYRRLPLAVVLPSTTQEVAAVLRYCLEQGVPVVPRGSGTSLSGGEGGVWADAAAGIAPPKAMVRNSALRENAMACPLGCGGWRARRRLSLFSSRGPCFPESLSSIRASRPLVDIPRITSACGRRKTPLIPMR